MAEELERRIGVPTAEEQMLIDLREGQYEAAGAKILENLTAGKPPAVLSIVRPDILFPLSEILLHSVTDTQPHATSEYRAELFGVYLNAACNGNPAAISALPKFATTPGQLVTALSLTLDSRDSVAEWRDGRKYVRFTGSYNPLHVGHRTGIRNTLEVVGSRSGGVVQVIADHPFKNDLPEYKDRFDPGKEKLYHSDLLDPTRVTMLDVPLGLGLARIGCEQIRLVADITGDDEMRWNVGSDKLMTDVRDVKAGKLLDQAGERFKYVHLYVCRRDTEDPDKVIEAISYAQERFGANVTLVPEANTKLALGAAATKIRSFRDHGNVYRADEMEFSDLTALNRERYDQSYINSMDYRM